MSKLLTFMDRLQLTQMGVIENAKLNLRPNDACVVVNAPRVTVYKRSGFLVATYWLVIRNFGVPNSFRWSQLDVLDLLNEDNVTIIRLRYVVQIASLSAGHNDEGRFYEEVVVSGSPVRF